LIDFGSISPYADTIDAKQLVADKNNILLNNSSEKRFPVFVGIVVVVVLAADGSGGDRSRDFVSIVDSTGVADDGTGADSRRTAATENAVVSNEARKPPTTTNPIFIISDTDPTLSPANGNVINDGTKNNGNHFANNVAPGSKQS
jgi:hypothetical protein